MKSQILLAVAVTAALAFVASAQDPAQGWMAYAVGTVPSGTTRITKMSMKWTVGADAQSSFSFYSPWFGMDPSDNLNLIQPVNPWSGSDWGYYTEWFDWNTGGNSNSQQQSIESGQTLVGSLTYDASSDSYFLNQTCLETGVSSTQTVKCADSVFVIPYVVYEKTFPCNTYPPDEKVTFHILELDCDGKSCIDQVKWQPKVKDANCDMTAHIESQTEISITWSTKSASVYDNMTAGELYDLNYNGWARRLSLERPRD